MTEEQDREFEACENTETPEDETVKIPVEEGAETEAPEQKEPEPAEELHWDTAAADKIAELEKKLAEAEKTRLLALADMDNQRKRFSKELEQQRFRVTQDTLFPFLQVFDHFNMAVKAAETPDAKSDSILKGMEMIRNEFDHAFTELGVEKIDAEGQKFDPNFHEAVAEEHSDSVPAGVVIRQWSCGCRMGSKLLKPAMVVVSSGPEEKAKDGDPE